MNAEEIADYAWNNSTTFDFGGSAAWDNDLFKAAWAKKNSVLDRWNKLGAGWYWFSVSMTYREMHDVPRPDKLPRNACDIGSQSHVNLDTFGSALLCQHDKELRVVIYNGHEGNVKNRVRTHFVLGNDSTGAIGLVHYPLSHKSWRVHMFSESCIKNIEKAQASRIRLLLNSATGRCAVESAWRTKYGWPILCKK
jgi:hypothetical protein